MELGLAARPHAPHTNAARAVEQQDERERFACAMSIQRDRALQDQQYDPVDAVSELVFSAVGSNRVQPAPKPRKSRSKSGDKGAATHASAEAGSKKARKRQRKRDRRQMKQQLQHMSLE